jgi:hypothetical protein
VHAEGFRPGGEVSHGDSPDVAVRYAEVFARLMADLADVTVASPLPNPLGALGPHGSRGVAVYLSMVDVRQDLSGMSSCGSV